MLSFATDEFFWHLSYNIDPQAHQGAARLHHTILLVVHLLIFSFHVVLVPGIAFVPLIYHCHNH